MHTRLFYVLAFALAGVILAGCAAPPVTPVPAMQQTASSTGLIDASSGKFLEFSGKLDSSASGPVKVMRVVTTAHRLQPSKEWMPTIIFCVKHQEGGARYCLNTYATSDGTRFVAELLSKESDSADVVTKRLPFDLAPFDSHYLDIVLLQDRLIMIIDDRKFFDHPLRALLDEYWFSCSSIVCSVDFLHPYQHPDNAG